MAFNKTQQKATFRNTSEVKKIEVLKIKRERQMHDGVPPPPPNHNQVQCSLSNTCAWFTRSAVVLFFGRIHLTQRRCIPNEQRRNEMKDTL